MTQEELNYIKDSFSQIIDDIAGNPDWSEAARAVVSDLGTLERELEEKVASLPSNLDEAAKEWADVTSVKVWGKIDPKKDLKRFVARANYRTGLLDGFKAGAELLAEQGWIDDGSMPPETKQESDTLQGHREWTESEPVLAWDSMYGCRVDWTRNGKWMSEQTGGYTGQVCHGIIAWRPIPKYKEKQ